MYLIYITSKGIEDGANADDVKIQRGLAEIQLLDKQLKVMTEKQIANSQSDQTLSLDDTILGLNENLTDSAPNTGNCYLFRQMNIE